MKRIIALGIAISASAGLLVAPTFATTASNNHGSIVKISNTCSDLANVASNNHGSIVKIDGGGQCDINEILNSSAVKDNHGSIVKISNVCGDASGTASGNHGSIVKIDSNGPCDKSKPTTVVVTPAEETPATSTETAPEKDTATKAAPVTKSDAPAELPKTGTTSNLLSALAGITVLAYMATRYVQSKQAVSALLNVK